MARYVRCYEGDKLFAEHEIIDDTMDNLDKRQKLIEQIEGKTGVYAFIDSKTSIDELEKLNDLLTYLWDCVDMVGKLTRVMP